MRSIGVALIATLYLASLAQAAERLSTGDRLPDRRFVVSGPRAYDVGAEDGSYPAMGFHTRGEMGGIWAPPIKLLDGVWAGIDGQWIGPATQFTSGWGHVEMSLPGRPGLTVTRTDFVPGAHRGVLIGLRFASTGAAQSFARVRAERDGDRWRTEVRAGRDVQTLRIGATLPLGARIDRVRLDGRDATPALRPTNRGLEVTVDTGAGEHRLEVRTR